LETCRGRLHFDRKPEKREQGAWQILAWMAVDDIFLSLDSVVPMHRAFYPGHAPTSRSAVASGSCMILSHFHAAFRPNQAKLRRGRRRGRRRGWRRGLLRRGRILLFIWLHRGTNDCPYSLPTIISIIPLIHLQQVVPAAGPVTVAVALDRRSLPVPFSFRPFSDPLRL
jgi:hypothetical protein